MKPNIYTNSLVIMVISSTTLLLIGIISLATPMRVVYADDSSDESQTDQSSPSSLTTPNLINPRLKETTLSRKVAIIELKEQLK